MVRLSVIFILFKKKIIFQNDIDTKFLRGYSRAPLSPSQTQNNGGFLAMSISCKSEMIHLWIPSPYSTNEEFEDKRNCNLLGIT